MGTELDALIEAERTRIISILDERQELFSDVDGFVHWWPANGGCISAWQLRVIADELDRRNVGIEKDIAEYFASHPDQEVSDVTF